MVKKVEILSSVSVQVTWDDGNTSRYHPVWLRYHCFCLECREQHSSMRKIPVLSMLTELSVKTAVLENGSLKVTCNEDDHKIIQPTEWLKSFSYAKADLNKKSSLRDIDFKRKPVAKFFKYEDLNQKGEKLGEFIEALDEYGIAFIDDVPCEKNKVKEVAELVAPVYKTLYDEVFSIVSVEKPINIAYMDVPLEFHQDLPYYESPPGYQLLHSVRLDPQVEGGANMFVDCFQVADQLKREYPEHFETLLKVPVSFQKIHVENGQEYHFEYQRPHISVNKDGKVIGVFWNAQAEGPLQVDEDLVDAYYKAYFKFAELMENSPSKGVYVNIDDFRNVIQVHYLKKKNGMMPKRIGNQCHF